MFSDQTLETFERYDKPSFEAITREFAYWQDIEIRHKGTVHRNRRQRILRLRPAHPADAVAGARPAPLASAWNSATRSRGWKRSPAPISSSRPTASTQRSRERYAEHFRPAVDLRPNKIYVDGIHQAIGFFPVLFPGDGMGGVYRPMPTNTRPAASTWVLETGHGHLAARRVGPDGRSRLRPVHGGCVRGGPGRPCADHQPVALAVSSR